MTLETSVDHIDHICQIAGNARHCGIGSDLDGAFGREQCPSDVHTIADLSRLPAVLAARGIQRPGCRGDRARQFRAVFAEGVDSVAQPLVVGGVAQPFRAALANMKRRDFLKTSALAVAGFPRSAFQPADARKRVGLIGTGWYGKTDLLRLIQVAPVEVVSLCDVDQQDARRRRRSWSPTRQASKKKPRTFADYREMLAEKDLDIVLIGTPDHWHALPMIAAIEAGADVYVQKPISVDVVEGQAMLAAARKHKRVVQVGTQRRSTPHLVDARDRVIRRGPARQDRPRRDLLLLPHARATSNPPDTSRPRQPRLRNVDRPGADAARTTAWSHPRSWRAFMEYGNGIVGDMCIHMLDMVRWMLDLGWPKRVSSVGGILVDKASKANITDTQTATFDFDDLQVVWTHRTWGDPPDPEYPWGATLLRRQRHAQGERDRSYDFIPVGRGRTPIHSDVTYELEQYPEDKTRRTWNGTSPRPSAAHMQDFLAAIEHARATGRRHRGGPHFDRELHPREPVDATRPHADVGPARGLIVGDEEANRCCAGRTASRGCIRNPRRCDVRVIPPRPT